MAEQEKEIVVRQESLSATEVNKLKQLVAAMETRGSQGALEWERIERIRIAFGQEAAQPSSPKRNWFKEWLWD